VDQGRYRLEVVSLILSRRKFYVDALRDFAEEGEQSAMEILKILDNKYIKLRRWKDWTQCSISASHTSKMMDSESTNIFFLTLMYHLKISGERKNDGISFMRKTQGH
jgi:hypothetical protein